MKNLVRKHLARILPIQRNGENQSIVYTSMKWIVIQNGKSDFAIFFNYAYKICLHIEDLLVSFVCTENENHLQFFYFEPSSKWTHIDISELLEVNCYRVFGKEELKNGRLFNGIVCYCIPKWNKSMNPLSSNQQQDQSMIIEDSSIQSNSSLSYPLYFLVVGAATNEFYGVDFFNRIWKCQLHQSNSTWNLEFSLYFWKEDWKITSLAFSNSRLFVGCYDGTVYDLKESQFNRLGQVKDGYPILLRITSSSSVYCLTQSYQLWLVKTPSSELLPFSGSLSNVYNEILFGIMDNEIYSIQQSILMKVDFTSYCHSLTILTSSSFLLLETDGSLVRYELTDSLSSYQIPHTSSILTRLDCSSQQQLSLQYQNQTYFNYLLWKSTVEKEFSSLIQKQPPSIQWEVNDHSLLARVSLILPSSVHQLLFILQDTAGEKMIIQHSTSLPSSLHSFTISPLQQSLFASICSVQLVIVSFPEHSDFLPVVKHISLGFVSLIDFAIHPFAFHKEKEFHLALPTILQLHTPPSLSYSTIRELLPTMNSDNVPVQVQLVPQGNATLICIKGYDLESMQVARISIHHKILEKLKEKEELWSIDLLKEYEHLDKLVEELKKIHVDSECSTSLQMRNRIEIIEKLVEINEKLSKMLL